MPKVSVIIPTYNRALLIGRAIQSVLNQSYEDLEIFVIDDGSTDDTERVIKEFQKQDKRIRCIRLDENKGAAAARNIGVKSAKGKYIAFQDSDDEWFPEKTEKQVKVFENTPPEVGVVYSDMWRITENKKEYFYSPKIMSGNKIKYKQALDYGVRKIGIQTALIKKECFDKVGMFDEKFPRLIDLELFIRLSKHYYFYHIEEPLVNYFDADKGISSNTESFVTAQKLILEKYFEDIQKDKKMLAKHYFSIGVNLCLNGDSKNGRNYLIKTVKAYPLNVKLLLALLLSFFGEDVYNKVTKIYQKIRSITGYNGKQMNPKP